MSMADYRAISVLLDPPAVLRPMGRTEPDLDLIKQVEQVTISALERAAWRFEAILREGIADPLEVDVFLVWQFLRWLLFGCKNSQEPSWAIYLRGGSPARLPAPPGGSVTGPRRLPSRCSATFAETAT